MLLQPSPGLLLAQLLAQVVFAPRTSYALKQAGREPRLERKEAAQVDTALLAVATGSDRGKGEAGEGTAGAQPPVIPSTHYICRCEGGASQRPSLGTQALSLPWVALLTLLKI